MVIAMDRVVLGVHLRALVHADKAAQVPARVLAKEVVDRTVLVHAYTNVANLASSRVEKCVSEDAQDVLGHALETVQETALVHALETVVLGALAHAEVVAYLILILCHNVSTNSI